MSTSPPNDRLSDAFRSVVLDFYAHAICPEENDPLVAAQWMYRRRDVHRLFMRALSELPVRPLRICDAGSGEAFNLCYALHRSLQDLNRDEKRSLALRGSEIVTLDVPSCFPERLEILLDSLGFARYRHQNCDLARALPLENGSIDVMMCTEVVEHLEQPASLLREFRRTIRPGGFLILTTPNEPSLPGRLKGWLSGRGARIEPSADMYTVDGVTLYGHISTKPTREWEALLSEAGFAIESFGTYRIIGNPANRDILSGKFGPVVGRFLLGGIASLAPPRLRRFLGANTTLLAR